MSLTADLYRQSLIADKNRAELEILQNSSKQRSLINSGSKDLASVAKKEAQLQNQRIQAETERKVAEAELKAAKNNKNKRNKLDVTV